MESVNLGRLAGALLCLPLLLAACNVTNGDSNGDVPSDAPQDIHSVPDAVEAVPVQPGTVRFVHISDTHIHGSPEAPSAGHVEQAVTLLNGVDFDADFVVVTGDLVDFLPDEYADPSQPGTIHTALQVLDGLKWPYHALTGNHEYYRDDSLNPTKDKAAREEFLAAMYDDGDQDYWFDHEGVRFVLMDSMGGDQWDKSAGLVGSFTQGQLSWLRDRLQPGMPTLLFFHHPPVDAAPAPGEDSLCGVIQDHPGTVKAIFAGHLHGFWIGDFCGVKYRLVGNTDPAQAFYYLVEYNGATDTLTIVNEAEIPAGTLPEFECDPAEGNVADPAAAVGSLHIISAGTMVSNLPGLEGFQGEGLSDFPPVVKFDAWVADPGHWEASLTLGISEGGFIRYVEGTPCEALTLTLDGDCLVSDQTSLELDVAPILEAALGMPLDPDWLLRATVENLWIEAQVDEPDGTPVLSAGLLHLTASATQAVADLKTIFVGEYCEGKLAGCVPGEGDMPFCPAEPGPDFYDAVPESCDMAVSGLSLRFILLFAASYPLDNIILVGEMWSTPVETSDTPQPGFADKLLFSNCTL